MVNMYILNAMLDTKPEAAGFDVGFWGLLYITVMILCFAGMSFEYSKFMGIGLCLIGLFSLYTTIDVTLKPSGTTISEWREEVLYPYVEELETKKEEIESIYYNTELALESERPYSEYYTHFDEVLDSLQPLTIVRINKEGNEEETTGWFVVTIDKEISKPYMKYKELDRDIQTYHQQGELFNIELFASEISPPKIKVKEEPKQEIEEKVELTEQEELTTNVVKEKDKEYNLKAPANSTEFSIYEYVEEKNTKDYSE